MNSNKKYIFFGLILNVIAFLIRELDILHIILPDFIRGFLEGFSISLGTVLILFGKYRENINLKTIKKYKIKIFNKLIGK